MALRSNKKGFFFTILAILMVSLFLLVYGIYNKFSERSSEQKRVETLDNFLQAVEQDLERQAYIMGFRALFIVENRISETGAYSADAEGALQEIILNGTLNQEPQPLMFGATWGEIESAINEKATKLNAEITLSPPIMSIYQNDPWKVIIEMNTTLDIRDKNDRVSWQIDKSIKSEVSVENFEDPLYLIATNGLVTQKITKTPSTLFVQGSNITTLIAHITNSYYTNTTLAPSFMQRLEGDMNASPYGIESFVHLPTLSAAGIPLLDKTVVDYIYFSASNPVAYRISGTPSWFKIDSAHLGVYGVGNLTL